MMQSFESVSKFNKEFVDGAMKGAAAWTNGIQAIAAETAEYAKTSMENGTAAFEKAAAAKSPEKAIEVQAEEVCQAQRASGGPLEGLPPRAFRTDGCSAWPDRYQCPQRPRAHFDSGRPNGQPDGRWPSW